MKNKKPITILVLCILVLSAIACLYGLFSSGGPGEHTFLSIRGQTIKIYGTGLYQYESAAQTLALRVQDIFTLVIAIPLLIVSLCLVVKESLRGKLLLTGTIGYFLYTYVTYAFLRELNGLFLIYVILMAMSLFAFILCMISFDLNKFVLYINKKMPVKFIGGFQIFLAIGLLFTWLPSIIAYLASGTIPLDLEHYNTLGYEAMDLGIMVPALFLSAVLIMKRKSIGYLLSSILILQSLSMITLISVLTIVQVHSGMEMPIVMALMFPVFNVIIIFCLILLLKNIRGNDKVTVNHNL